MKIHHRARGFTLLEILVVLAVLMTALLLVLPALQNLIVRSKVEGSAREIASMLQIARLEAVKRSVPMVVRLDPVSNEVIAFADVDGVDSDDPPDGIYNPVAGDPAGQTDLQIGRAGIQERVSLRAPGGQPAVDGLPSIDGFWVVRFNPDGSAQDVGAYRLADVRDNFLEVRVGPAASARVTVNKWDGTGWWSRGEGGHPWRWN